MSPTTDSDTPLSTEDRHDMVAVAAYYLAEQRDFAPGQADQDWQRAEQQIDAMLSNLCRAGLSPHLPQQIGVRNALRMWGS